MTNLSKEDTALDVQNYSIYYGNTPALWDLNFSIPKGKLVGVVGPNGAGKSTLLKGILGLIEPDSGTASFPPKSSIAYVPQKESVDWNFPITVEELVLMGCYGKLKCCQRPTEEQYGAVDIYLDMVGMKEYRSRQISQLSGGQQQRAFLARALMEEADIYFMDEPFVGIDQATEKLLLEILKRLKGEGKTVFVVHHDLNTVRSTFDWALLLNLRLIKCGPIEEVFTEETLKTAYGKYYTLLDEAFKKT